MWTGGAWDRTSSPLYLLSHSHPFLFITQRLKHQLKFEQDKEGSMKLYKNGY